MPRRMTWLIGAATLAYAQSYQGGVSGVVKDVSGGVVPGVRLELIHQETGQRRVVSSDSQGRYSLVQLPTGSYLLRVQREGFRTFERTLTLEVGAHAVVDPTLELGAVSESVTVDVETPLVEAASGAVGTVVDNYRISSLPLNGRNAFELVALSPGVIPTGVFGLAEPYEKRAQASFSAGGGRSLSNEILLDGAAVTGSSEFNMPLNSPPLEAIQEFKVQLNSYSAEFGRSQGAVVNSVTRSGTNQLRGAVYDYLRNDNLDANNFFNNAAGRPKADLRWNQFGATLGGPILLPGIYNGRNKSFFFLSYEGMRYVRGVNDLRRVPTPLELNGDFSRTVDAQRNLVPIYDPFSTRPNPALPGRFIRDAYPGNQIPGSQINGIAARVSRYYPAPNQEELFPGGPNYFFGGNQSYRSDRGIAKFDHNFSEAHRSSFRYSQLDDLVKPPLIYRNLASPTPGPQHQSSYTGLLEHTWLVRPTMVINAKMSAVRFANDLLSYSAGFRFADELGLPKWLQDRSDFLLFPAFNVSPSPVGPIGPPAARNFTTNWNPMVSVNWVRGAHSLKTGFDYRGYFWNQFLPSAPSGNYTFASASTGGPDPDTTGRTGSALASFLLGAPSEGSFGITPALSFQNVYTALYVQDDWRISSRLSLNFGLRWDYEGPRTERFNRITSLVLDPKSPIADAVNARYGPILAQLRVSNPALAAVLPQTLDLRGGLRFAQPGNRRQMEPDRNNFAPRFGFAFQLRPGWLLRGGFGIFFAPQSGAGILPGEVAAGYLATTSLAGFGADRRPLVSLSDPFANGLVAPTGNSLGLATNVGSAVTSYLGNNRTGYVEQWNLNIQRQLGRQTAIEIGYLGSHGVKLFGPNVPLNLPSRATVDLGPLILNSVIPNPFTGAVPANTPLGQQPTTTVRQLLLPFPHFTGVTSKSQNLYNSNYHALTIRLERRMARGLGFLLAYTAGKSIDDGSGWIEAVQGQLGTTSLDVENRRLDRSISSFDRSQRLVVTLNYRLPFRHRIFGGWQVNLINTFMTGLPIALGRTAYLIADVHASDTGQGRRGVSAANPWMNPNAFRALTFGEVSNIPRTLPDLRGPGTANTDLSVFKEFRLREKLTAQLRAEFFNAFNRTELGMPNAQPLGATFGLITSTRQRSREGQLGLRLGF